MKKRILALILCALTIFTTVPVTPLGALYSIEASAADEVDITELEKVYALVPDKSDWGNYVSTNELQTYCDIAETIIANPSSFKQEKIDEYTNKLREAIDNLKWHTLGISLDKTKIEKAFIGNTYSLKATLTPNGAGDEIVWTSSDTKAVTIQNSGANEATVAIKGYSSKAVKITATSNGYSASCNITILNPIGAVSASPETISLFEGQTSKITTTVTGVDSSFDATGDVIYTWHSTDEKVAVVNDSGKVVAVGAGTCKIEIVATDSYGYTAQASCSVTVKKTVYVEKLTLDADLTNGSMYLNAKQSLIVKVGISPSAASVKTISWTSSDTSVATVTGASVSSAIASIKLNALAPGKTKITYSATDGSGVSGYFYVVVRPLISTLTLGESIKVISPTAAGESISVKITPEDAGNLALSWTTSDANVCTVSATGVLYPKKSGECIITATTTDGSGISKQCRVVVADKTNSISISKTNISLKAGEAHTLKATVKSSDYTYYDAKWKSSNTSVATVSSTGVVTAKGPGSCVITATAYDDSTKSVVCVVNVTQPVKGVSLPATLEVAKGGTKTISATITPSNATNKNVTWKSSNTSVATIDANGKITGKEKGTTTITCTTADGSFTAKCTVSVVIAATSISLNKTSATMNSGDTLTLSVTFTPSNTTNKTVTWKSSNTSVATVSSSGKITAKSGGTCTITATSSSGSCTATCKITVKQEVDGVSLDTSSFSIYSSGSRTLKATVVPSTATNKGVTWTSSNNNIAVVSSDGKVTGVNPGTCTITATTKDGGHKAVCTVTVYKKVSVTGLTLDSSKITMNKGESTTILATITPSNASEKTITWSSTDTAVATVSSKGVVKAVGAGTTVITALTKDGNYLQQCKITVKQAVTGVKLNVSEAKLAAGKTKTLKATVSPSDATNKGITWSSSNKDIATVNSSGVVTAVKKGSATITAKTKDGGYVATCTIDVYLGVTSVTINSDKVKLPKGETTVLTATVKPAGAENKDVVWTSSDEKIATVNANGKVTGKKTGSVTITATTVDGAKKDTCIVDVVQLVSKIEINVSRLKLETGKSKTITAKVLPSTASDKTVKFSSSNKKVATISSTGVLKAVGPGTATITVKSQDGGAKVSFVVTVTQPVKSISVSPSKATVNIGGMKALTVTFEPENATNKKVTWKSSDTSIAKVSSKGVVTGVKKGKVTITCTSESGGYKAKVTITVTQGVKGVTLNKTALKLNVGRTSTLVPTIKPSGASNKAVTWSSSNKDVATVDSKGKVTAKSAGYAKITAKTKDGGFKAYCEVLVIQPVTGIKIDKTSAKVKEGSKLTLKASVKPANASDAAIRWSSSNTKVAKVSAYGVVSGVNSGTAVITAKTNDGGYKATCKITVVQPVTGVKLNTTSKKLYLGATYTLKATVSPSDADNKSVTWSSSDTSIAKVSSKGVVTPLKAGTVKITVKTKDGGYKATCTFKILKAVTSITLNSSSVTVKAGQKYTLKATIKPSDATDKTVKWSTSNKSVATVSSSGVVTAVNKGTATITAKTENGLTKTCKITVTRPVSSVSLNKTSLTVYTGNKTTLTATVLPKDANDTGVTWSVSDKNILSVSTKGVVTALKAGKATVTVKTNDGGYTAKCTFTVLQHVESITLDKQSITIKNGETAKINATIKPSDASDKTVKWSTSNSSVATVSSSGVVTAVNKGTATITAKTENGLTKTCKVTVIRPVSSVSLNKTALTVYAGDKTTLTATVLPKDANDTGVTWSVSDKNILSVSTKGVVTALKAGKATVTVKTNDGGYTAKCTFTVLQHVESITLDKESIVVKNGDTAKLNATIAPSNASNKGYSYSSSDNDVATVDKDGNITTVGLGECVITVLSNENGKTDTCVVNVVQRATGVELEFSEKTIFVGESFTIKANVLPEDAYYRTCKWVSSDEKVVTVNDKGVVTALKSGEATITAITTDGDFEAYCTITTLQKATSIKISESDKKVLVGESFKLTAEVLPQDCYNKNYTWSIDNDQLASIDENGNVITFAPGTVVITVTSEDGSFTDTCTVTIHQSVTDITIDTETVKLYKGETKQITANVIPENASDKTLIWQSDDESVATVSSSGLITAIGKGKAVITVSSKDNPEIIRMCTVECILKVERIETAKQEYVIFERESETLNAVAYPLNAEDTSLTYKSNDEAVATVDENGNVTAISKGEAIITITSVKVPSVTKQVKIIVARAVTGVELSETEIVVAKNGTHTLFATVNPYSADIKDVVWSSENEAIAVVKDGVVRGIAGGETTVTVTTVNKNFTATCKVKVIELPESVAFSEVKYTVGVGKTNSVSVTVLPETANDKSVTFESDNENIVTVDNNGVITGVSRGTANITVKTVSGNAQSKVTVEVVQLPQSVTLEMEKEFLYIGESTVLVSSVLPENTNDKTLSFTSSDESVVTVDENGKLTGIKQGFAEITAASIDKNVLCRINVEVRQQATEITISKSEHKVVMGESFELTAVVGPENTYDKSISWKSSNSAVATVDENGVVTTKAVGTAVITAMSSNAEVKAECTVTVIRFVDEITLNKNEHTMVKGDKFKLTASFLPEFATETELVWTSSDESVATVSKDGEVTAVKGGYATIKAQTTTEGVYAECKITVDVRSEKVILSKDAYELYCGEEFELTATVAPEDTINKDIIWSSKNENIATVENGVVKAIDAGVAIIVAKAADGDVYAECEVTVLKHVEGVSFASHNAVAYIGKTIVLSPEILPQDASNKSLIWESSDPKVAKVENGVVTGVSKGTAVITAESVDGGYVDFVTVTVKQGVDEITLSTYKELVEKNSTLTLTATVLPADANNKTIIWQSSDESIAVVENGVVTISENAGTVVIKAISADNEKVFAQCQVTVKQEVTEIKLSETSKSLRAGQKATLIATVLPSNAHAKDVTWSSTDVAVATVSGNGEITAKKPGTTIIIATNEESGIVASCMLKVYLELDDFEIESISVDCGASKSVKIKATPSNHDEGFTYKSSDESIFTVDKNGVVTAKDKPGTATLTVVSTISGKTKSIKIETIKRVEGIRIDTKVPEDYIIVGDSLQLEYTVLPNNAANKAVVFSTSDAEVASVSDTGYVTFLGVGDVTITVTTLDKGFKASITFSVFSID